MDGVKSVFNKLLKQRESIALIALVIICLVFSLVAPTTFPTPFNMMNVLRQASVNAILAVGMTYVIISGGIDLSVSSTVSLSGTIAAIAMVNFGANAFVGVLAGLAVGVTVGLLNGLVITTFDVPPIIATLGLLTGASGLALVLTGGSSVSGLAEGFSIFGQGNLGILPVPAIIMLIVYIIGFVILTKTKFGASLFGVGGNEEAARLAGISVKKIKIGVYIISGLMASVAGIILASRLDSGQPLAGEGLELNAIAAVVIGGASVSGGRGGVVGSLIGALIIGVLNNGFDLIGVGRYYQMILTGLVLILAVALQKKTKGPSH